MTVRDDVLNRLLEHFPRAECTFEPVSLQVTGSWGGLLVQLEYRRDDPVRPGARTTFVAAHHPELGSLSYEMVDGQGLLTVDEWRAGAPRRDGIWWTTSTAGSSRPSRVTLLWHDVLPLVDRIESVTDAARVAEHLDAALEVEVGARPRRRPVTDDGDRTLTAGIDGLERLLAQVESMESRLSDGPDDTGAEGLAGTSPAANENRTVRMAMARLAVADTVVVRRELHAARERVDAALSFSREARDRVDARRV